MVLRIGQGDTYYYNKNNILHREDGPAIEFKRGRKGWFLDGIEYTHEEYKKKMRRNKIKEISK